MKPQAEAGAQVIFLHTAGLAERSAQPTVLSADGPNAAARQMRGPQFRQKLPRALPDGVATAAAVFLTARADAARSGVNASCAVMCAAMRSLTPTLIRARHRCCPSRYTKAM